MAARIWTALVLMAAVFTMHGLQCSSAADGPRPGHAMPTTATAPDGAHGPAGDPAIDHAVASVLELIGSAGTRSAVMAGEHLLQAGGHQAPHGDADHLWALCLAVLAAGVAVLLALLRGRLPRVARQVRACVRARAPNGLALPRPPDLSVLCVLRT